MVVDAALFLGNDYCPRVSGNGVAKVLLGTLEPKEKHAGEGQTKQRRRKSDSMIDMLSKAPNHRDWINNSLPNDIAKIFWRARKYMLNAPVLEPSTESNSVNVVSLNPLPDECSDLASYIEEDGLAQLITDHKLLYDIYY